MYLKNLEWRVCKSLIITITKVQFPQDNLENPLE
jgi:hypothetical protein